MITVLLLSTLLVIYPVAQLASGKISWCYRPKLQEENMTTNADKTQENKSQSVANAVSQKQSGGESTFQFVDNRPEAVAQRKLQKMSNNRPKVAQLRAFQEISDYDPQAKQAITQRVSDQQDSTIENGLVQKTEGTTSLLPPAQLEHGRRTQSAPPRFVSENVGRTEELSEGTRVSEGGSGISGEERENVGEAGLDQQQGQITGDVQTGDNPSIEQQLREVYGARQMAATAATEIALLMEEVDMAQDMETSEAEDHLSDITDRYQIAQELMMTAENVRVTVLGGNEGQRPNSEMVNILLEIEIINRDFSAEAAIFEERLQVDPQQAAPPKASKKGWIRLAFEAAGHFAQATIQTVIGLIAAIGTGGAALLPGIVSAVAGVGQAIIGVCKSIRAHFIRIGQGTARKAAMAKLITFEGAVGVATAIASLVAGVMSPTFWKALISGIFKAVDILGGGIKMFRGAFAGQLSKSTTGILIMVESVLGFMSGLGLSIGTGIAKGALWIFGVVAQALKQVVTLFKGARGAAKKSER